MKFRKRYFKAEIYEYGVQTLVLLPYSRLEFIVKFRLKRLFRKGIKDKESFVPPERIEIRVKEISAEEAKKEAEKLWPDRDVIYIINDEEVTAVET